MDILNKILDAKRERIAKAKATTPLTALRAECVKRPQRGFRAALTGPEQTHIIAEIKQASPSKGIIRIDMDAREIAQQYTAAGAAAISVLTEEDFFQGSLAILRQVRTVTSLPLLRKDFLIDEYQIYEAAAAGADAFLLIVAALDKIQLLEFSALGNELGLDALVEVHTMAEMAEVMALPHPIIGINNRNLKTFVVDLNVSLQLAPQAPKGAILVSESGINSPTDIKRLQAAGYHAFLVGEQLMRAPHPGIALSTLLH